MKRSRNTCSHLTSSGFFSPRTVYETTSFLRSALWDTLPPSGYVTKPCTVTEEVTDVLGGREMLLCMCMYRYYTETRGDIFMPRGEAEGQKYINPSFCVIPDIHSTVL